MDPKSEELSPNTRSFLIIVIAAVLCFGNGIRAEFTYDNSPLIRDSVIVTGQVSWSEAFKRDFWWPTNEGGFYRPLTLLTFRVQNALTGYSGRLIDYHIGNIALHALNGCLFFLLLLRLFGSVAMARAAALVWLVHPLQVECVTNLIGRADQLSATTLLAGLLVYTRGDTPDGGIPPRRILAVCLIFFAGTLCKEQAFLLAGAILLYDLTCGTGKFSARIPVYVALTAATGVSLAIRTMVYQSSTLVGRMAWNDIPFETLTLAQQLATAAKIAGSYLCLIFWPEKLTNDYIYNQVRAVTWPPQFSDVLLCLFALTALVLSVGLVRRVCLKNPVTFLCLTTVLLYLPAFHSLFVVGPIMGERWMHLPLLGFIPVLTWVTIHVLDRIGPSLQSDPRRGRILHCVLAFLVLVLTARSYSRNHDWQNELSLWTSARAVSTGGFKTRAALSYTWSRFYSEDPDYFSRPGSADLLYERPAFRRYRALYRSLYSDTAYRSMSLLDLMIEENRAAVRIAPSVVNIRDQLSQFLIDRAVISDSAQRREFLDEAVSVLTEAIRWDRWKRNWRNKRLLEWGKHYTSAYQLPTEPIYARLAIAHLISSDTPAAISVFHAFRKEDPLRSEAHEDLGRLLIRMDQPDTAAYYLCQAALTAAPDRLIRLTRELREISASDGLGYSLNQMVRLASEDLLNLFSVANVPPFGEKIVRKNIQVMLEKEPR